MKDQEVELQEIGQRLDCIEALIRSLIEGKREKDFYSTSEVAEILNKAEFTVREWARLGRIAATKKECGRGRSKEWSISHEELTRFQNEGLLPVKRHWK